MQEQNVIGLIFIVVLLSLFVGFTNLLIIIGSLARLITRSQSPMLLPWVKPVVTKSPSATTKSPRQELLKWSNRTISAIESTCSESEFKVEVGPYPPELDVERPAKCPIRNLGSTASTIVTPSMLIDCLVCEPIDPLMSGTLAINMPAITLTIPETPKKKTVDGSLADTVDTEKIIQQLESTAPTIEPAYGALAGFTGSLYRQKYKFNYELFYGEVKAHQNLLQEYKKLLILKNQYNQRFIDADRKTNQSYEDAVKHHTSLTESFQRLLLSEKSKALAFVLKLKNEAEKIKGGYETGEYLAVQSYFDMFLMRLPLPTFIPKDWEIHYDEANQILVVDYRFLALYQVDFVKVVHLMSGDKLKSLNKNEKRAISAAFYPVITLRLAKEIIHHDFANRVQAICLNGWVKYRDGATGQEKNSYIASLFAQKKDLLNISLENVDPVKCFESLKGRVIRTETLEIAPVIPVIQFDKNDERFIEGRDVLDAMPEGQNLASIDWEDFEHLVRELFSKLFSKPGIEVRVTQASRDKGVDAVVFDPTPITGGKFVIQAKRYVNVVDVSAVRDLYGTLMNEGASKGILVTTSNYGADSYEFAKNKPINLINGAELLGLLEAHGYKARIDLEEARLMAAGQQPSKS